MSDNTKAALAASLAGGYLLGRSGKGKLALAVAAYVTSKKLQAKPQELLTAGVDKAGGSSQFSQLGEQVRTELLSVGRKAVKAAVDQRLGTFADSLADRTKALSELPETGDDDPGEAGRAEDEQTDGPVDGQESGKSRGRSGNPEPAEKPAKASRSTTAGKKPSSEQAASAKKTDRSPTGKSSEKSAGKTSTESRSRR